MPPNQGVEFANEEMKRPELNLEHAEFQIVEKQKKGDRFARPQSIAK